MDRGSNAVGQGQYLRERDRAQFAQFYANKNKAGYTEKKSQTDGRTDGQMDEQTKPLIESLCQRLKRGILSRLASLIQGTVT